MGAVLSSETSVICRIHGVTFWKVCSCRPYLPDILTVELHIPSFHSLLNVCIALVRVNSELRWFHLVNVGSVSDVSEVHAASIFRPKVCTVDMFPHIYTQGEDWEVMSHRDNRDRVTCFSGYRRSLDLVIGFIDAFDYTIQCYLSVFTRRILVT
jgi:hypothetical protein